MLGYCVHSMELYYIILIIYCIKRMGLVAMTADGREPGYRHVEEDSFFTGRRTSTARPADASGPGG